MKQQDNSSPQIKAAVIGGIFAIIAACVGGIFLILNTLVDNGFVVIGPSIQAGNPEVPATMTSRPAIQPVDESYDCTTMVIASRPLVAHDSGDACWLQLVDGGAADITFDDTAQITYRTSSSGDDIYFYIANVGDKITGVVGATIRPSRFVISGYGNYENVKQFEIEYHSPGGGWVTCLRDANNNFQPLNSVCM